MPPVALSDAAGPDPGAAAPRTGPRPARCRKLRRGVAVLAAGWLTVLGAHLAHVDWLLPPVVLGGLMGLQHRAGTALDRLVLALVQAFGALCVAGLLYSVWPWHLHPVAIAGSAVTVLVGIAALSGRSWTAPTRVRPADRWVALGVLAVAGLIAVPFALRDLGARLGIFMQGEDLARHFVVYDMIGQVGGYAFLHTDATRRYVPDSLDQGIRNYPQGVHFGYAVLDRFIRSAATSGDGRTALDVMLWLLVGTFVFLALAVLWSLRRVAGPGTAAERLVPAVALAAAWLVLGDPAAGYIRGFPNQIVGLALAAVLTAVVVRPLAGFADQVVTVALLVVGISFSYHLYLPYAGAAAVLWTLRAGVWRGWPQRAGSRHADTRHASSRRRIAVLVAGAATAPVALLTPVLNLHATQAGLLVSNGTALPVDRPAVLVLVVLVSLGLVLRGGQRAPSRRLALTLLTAAVAAAGALAVTQVMTIGRTIYYFEKALHLVIVVALVGIGGLVRRTRGRVRRDRGLAGGLAVTLALTAGLAAAGGRWHSGHGSYGLRSLIGVDRGSPDGGRDALLMATRRPDGDRTMDVDLMGNPYRNWYATLFASAIERNYRYGHEWYGFLAPYSPPVTMDALERMVASSPVRVRLYVANPRASFLAVDADASRPPRRQPGGDPDAFGDPQAPTNLEAARSLAARYPGKVQVVRIAPNL